MPFVLLLSLLGLFAFVVLGAAGFLACNSRRWAYVDLIYYPLAAVGVALLFAASGTQRELFELGQLAEAHNAKLAQISSERPNTQFQAHEGLLTSSIALISTIPEFAAVCAKVTSQDARCSVAKKLADPIAKFVHFSASGDWKTQEQKLAATCNAGRDILINLRRSDAISSLIGNELLTVYDEALQRDFHVIAYDEARQFIGTFPPRAEARITWIRGALNMQGESIDFVLDAYRAEARYGEVILLAFLPCIVAPRKELDQLTRWTQSRLSEEEELKRLDQARLAAKQTPAVHPFLARLHLKLWPFVLIAALALKFGKGVAALRKEHLNPSKGKLSPPQEPDAAAPKSHNETSGGSTDA